MRIVTSGTHSVGKSTVVWDFLKAHPDYIREEEPYRAVCENHDNGFPNRLKAMVPQIG